MKEPPNKITGANAGGPRQLPMRTRWAARVAQFGRWANEKAYDIPADLGTGSLATLGFWDRGIRDRGIKDGGIREAMGLPVRNSSVPNSFVSQFFVHRCREAIGSLVRQSRVRGRGVLLGMRVTQRRVAGGIAGVSGIDLGRLPNRMNREVPNQAAHPRSVQPLSWQPYRSAVAAPGWPWRSVIGDT